MNQLSERGINRRQFMKFCAGMTAALALPGRYTERIAYALQAPQKPPLVWLDFQECAGCSESLLRASSPSIDNLVLETLSVNYMSIAMAAAGHQAEASLQQTMEDYPGGYIAVVEGSIPTNDGGVYATVAGRSAPDIATEVCRNAAATISVGACAFFGGWPSAAPNPTGAVGVDEAVPGLNLINIPGCPPNAVNMTAAVVHYLTFGELPATDHYKRPLFAFGQTIHDSCERRAHYDAGRFVQEYGDEGHRKGWCLYKMGCKGPSTYHNCPAVRWNEGTSWPVMVGHGCIGCSEPDFWDAMSPFYRRLPDVPGFGVQATADGLGLTVAAVVGGGFAAHGAASGVRYGIKKRRQSSDDGSTQPTQQTDEPPTESPESEEEDPS